MDGLTKSDKYPKPEKYIQPNYAQVFPQNMIHELSYVYSMHSRHIQRVVSWNLINKKYAFERTESAKEPCHFGCFREEKAIVILPSAIPPQSMRAVKSWGSPEITVIAAICGRFLFKNLTGRTLPKGSLSIQHNPIISMAKPSSLFDLWPHSLLITTLTNRNNEMLEGGHREMQNSSLPKAMAESKCCCNK